MFEYDFNTYVSFGQMILAGLVLLYLEGSGKFRLGYSKFRKGAGISTRLAMFLIYFIPLAVYAGGWYARGMPSSMYHLALLSAFTLHFGKRVLESLFLHKYSRPMGLVTTIMITGGYSFLAWNSERIHDGFVTAAQGNDASLYPTIVAGGILFLAGQVMNLRHHILLANLRRDSANKSEYRVPEGGLFPLVACPHYLFEIIAWIGVAVMSGHLLVWGMVFIMAAYLTGRSRATTVWYRENVPDYPARRKALIPFVY